jgi:LCP family protein required for cell wall assembly
MKKPLLIILILIVLGGLIAGGIFFFQKWNQPLGASLGLPTRTPMAETQNDENETSPSATPFDTLIETDKATSTDEVILATPTQAPTVPQPVCGGPPLLYILGSGVDTKDPNYLYGLADVIRIVRIDFIKPKVTVLTLPRDLWVELPDITEKYADRVTHGKLNQAYLYGGPGMGYYEGPGGGPGLLARTIAHNYGLYVDHYSAVNMLAFEGIVDALGGIDIYLDQDWDGRPVDENTIDLGYFTAGQHHMNGSEALRFARIRKKYSEVTRTDNQTLVICALKEKMLTPSVVGSIPKLIDALIGTIQTDLTPAQISQLTCVLPKLGEDDLQFVRFPDEKMVQGRIYDPNLGNTTFVWDISLEDIRQFIQDFENDAIPVESDGGMLCP